MIKLVQPSCPKIKYVNVGVKSVQRRRDLKLKEKQLYHKITSQLLVKFIKNSFYSVGCLTANRFSCSRCIQHKGNINFHKSTSFCQRTFHNDARNTCELIGRKMCRRTITQRAIQKKCKCSTFSVQYDNLVFFSCTKQISFQAYK